MDPEIILYSFAMGLSVTTLALYLWYTYSDFVSERLQSMRRRGGEAGSFVFRIVRPFARFFGSLVSAGLGWLEQSKGGRTVASYLLWVRVRIQRALIAAGSPEGLTADEFAGLVCFSVLAWTVGGLFVWAASGFSFFIPVGIIVGVAHPVLWLRSKVHRRKQEIRVLMPYALDLLTLSVEAGLDFVSALGRIGDKLRGTALGEEFEELLRVIRLGQPRAEALREMANRVDMPEVGSFASSLVQADELGASLDQVLRIQADQLRTDRYNRAEKKAMEAPVKILFPLIAFIFPTVFIILFAPIGISYLSRLWGI